ncbi:hypothetical protein [Undibacterium sp. Tian12W]|uniref:hypothetical protein n=1 Tax=Undibacterium sp. Tian12W TaxID=3413054 RepID=UPI003BF3F30D
MSQLRINIFKSFVCFFAIAALLVIFLHKLLPNVSPSHTFPYIALGIFVFIFSLYLTIIIRSGFNQRSINKGIIDPAWPWLSVNSPGQEFITSSNNPVTLAQDINSATSAAIIACSVDIGNSCPVSGMDSSSY